MYNRRRVHAVFLLLLAFLAGCDQFDRLLFPTLTPFPTPTLYPSKTPTPTQTFTPTATFTPTSIPVARIGTALPVSPQPIDVQNVNHLEKIAEYGRGMLQQVDWSADGKLLAIATTQGLWLYDANSLRAVRKLETDGIQRSVKFSPDGKWLASGSDRGAIQVWDMASGALDRTLQGQHFAILGLAFSSDGSRLASSAWDASLWVWQVSSGIAVRKFSGMRSPALQISFGADDERLLAWSPLDQLKVWRLSDGKTLQDYYIGLDRFQGSGTSAQFSFDGSTFIVDQDSVVRVFNTANGTTRNLLSPFYAPVDKVVLSHDGALAAVLNASEIQIWDTGRRVMVRQIPLTAPVKVVLFSVDDSRLFAVNDALNLWALDAEDTQPLRALADFSPGTTYATRVENENTLFSALVDGQIFDLDLATGQIRSAISAPQNAGFFRVAVSADGSLAAGSVGNRTILLWNVGGNAAARILKGHTQIVNALGFSPDGVWLASAGGDKTVRVWQTADGSSVTALEMPATVSKVQFSTDGHYLAAACPEGIRVWDTNGWKETNTFRGYTFSFAPAGHALVSAYYQYSEQTVEIRLLEGNQDTLTIPAHGRSLALSPDASLAATAGNTISIWRVSDGAQLANLTVSSPFGDVMFSPNGSMLIYRTWDGGMTVWTAAP